RGVKVARSSELSHLGDCGTIEGGYRVGYYKGYSEDEVDAIRANTYVGEEDEEFEDDIVGVVDELDGVSPQTEKDGCWTWKKPSPHSRKSTDNGNLDDIKSSRRGRKEKNLFVRYELLKEFNYLIYWKVMTLPFTIPCAHNFCKPFWEDPFIRQNFVRERTFHGSRQPLRTQKNVIKCPSCPTDISGFLQNPQEPKDVRLRIKDLEVELTKVELESARLREDQCNQEFAEEFDKIREAINQTKSAKADKIYAENIAFTDWVDRELESHKAKYKRLGDQLQRARKCWFHSVVSQALDSDLLRSVIAYFIEEVKRFKLE
ncbi:hypothetical protein GIB67_031757, partial [Kingdonia uniflora]